jgi:hypothetical protein
MLKRIVIALALGVLGTPVQTEAIARHRDYLRHAGRMARLLAASLVACSTAIGAAVAATTTTTLVTSDQATVYGQQFTLTATVTPSSGGVAVGTVKFTNTAHTVVLGSAALNETGQASVIVPGLAAGAYSVIAEYLGSGDLEASTSAFVLQVVAPADTTTTLTMSTAPDPLCPTVTFDVTVTTNAPGNGTPAGFVTFQAGGPDIFPKAFPVVNGKVVLRSNSERGEGVAMFTATFTGGGNFKRSVSPATPYLLTNGPRSQVNTYTKDSQEGASVAPLAGGGFVVIWTSIDYSYRDFSHVGTFGQRYDASDKPVGKEFRINNVVAYPSVAGLADGGFVVSWENRDSSGDGVYAQRYNAAGQRQGAAFLINTTTAGDQYHSSITGLPDGGFVFVWLSKSPFNSDRHLMARRYNAAGSPVTKELKLFGQASVPSDTAFAKVASLPSGGFVVVWKRETIGGSNTIFVRRFTPAGVPVGAIASVANVKWPKDFSSADVVVLKDGSFVLTWEFEGKSVGQRYTAAGLRTGALFQINTTSGSYGPVPALLADGGFVVVWRMDHNRSFDCRAEGVMAQRYDDLGRRRGEEFMVTGPHLSGLGGGASVVRLPGGGFVVTWTDQEPYFFPNGLGIFRRRYDN